MSQLLLHCYARLRRWRCRRAGAHAVYAVGGRARCCRCGWDERLPEVPYDPKERR